MQLGTYINKKSGKEWILDAIIENDCIVYSNSGAPHSRMINKETFAKNYKKK